MVFKMTNKIDKMFFIEEKIVKGKYPLSGTKPETQSKMLHLQPYILASPVAQTVKNLPEMQETQVQSLGQENPLE